MLNVVHARIAAPDVAFGPAREEGYDMARAAGPPDLHPTFTKATLWRKTADPERYTVLAPMRSWPSTFSIAQMPSAQRPPTR